jgi:hypothetical protein
MTQRPESGYLPPGGPLGFVECAASEMAKLF